MAYFFCVRSTILLSASDFSVFRSSKEMVQPVSLLSFIFLSFRKSVAYSVLRFCLRLCLLSLNEFPSIFPSSSSYSSLNSRISFRDLCGQSQVSKNSVPRLFLRAFVCSFPYDQICIVHQIARVYLLVDDIRII